MNIKAIDIAEVTKDEQIGKFLEEVLEFIEALEKHDIENIKEEFCDIITAGAGVLQKHDIPEDEIERYFNSEHNEKLKKRGYKPREDGRMNMEKLQKNDKVEKLILVYGNGEVETIETEFIVNISREGEDSTQTVTKCSGMTMLTSLMGMLEMIDDGKLMTKGTAQKMVNIAIEGIRGRMREL